MSLVGIDVGSSATKAAVYGEDGSLLAQAVERVPGYHPQPGWWESDPGEVWDATLAALTRVAAAPAVRRDSPRGLAISASGREVFPVAPDGSPLGGCLRTADTRGAEIAAVTATRASDNGWRERCGYVPGRMDPINRLLWWRLERPAVFAAADRFLGWHEFLTLRMAGRAIADHSLAGKWLTYDLATGAWSRTLLAELDVDERLLPAIATAGTLAGTLNRELATEMGWPHPVAVAVGAFDTSCCALGAGAVDLGQVGLASGSWESVVAPTPHPPSGKLGGTSLSIGPHPGASGFGVFGLSPNGTAVLDWARRTTRMSLSALENGLAAAGPEPSPVLAIPHLQGASSPWRDDTASQGILMGMTLATTRLDVVRALMEGIACDLLRTVDLLRRAGVAVDSVCASGGGARSGWWMQLKADLIGVPVDVAKATEAGTFGAALLAGVAVGAYDSIAQGVNAMVEVQRRYDPDTDRGRRYEPLLNAQRAAMEALLPANRLTEVTDGA